MKNRRIISLIVSVLAMLCVLSLAGCGTGSMNYIIGNESSVTKVTEEELNDLIPMVMVNGEIYMDTGHESTVEASDEVKEHYSFENSVYGEDEYSYRWEEILNAQPEKTAELEGEDRAFLEEFVLALDDVYGTDGFPDFSRFYHDGNQERKENRLLMESWIYECALIQTDIKEVGSNIESVYEVVKHAENVKEVYFRLHSCFIAEDGHIAQEQWRYCTVFLADTVDGMKILSFYMPGYELEMMAEQIKENVPAEELENAPVVMEKAIYDRITKNRAELMEMEAAEQAAR